MTWTRFEDRFPWHRKVRKLSDAAFRLHVSGVCWSVEHLTDGAIATDDLDIVSDTKRPDRAVIELVDRGIWEVTGNGWHIHDFHVYQPTSEQVRHDRSKAAERQKRARDAARNKGASTPPVMSQSRRDDDVTNGGSSIPPSRPVPIPTQPKEPTTLRSELRDTRVAFDEFWSVFPKKVAKVAAQRRFETLVKRGIDPAEIIAGAKAYRESRHGEDPKFTKQPDGWLNAGRWQDEPPPAYHPPDGPGQATAKAQGWLDVGADPTRQEITTGGTP